MGSEFGFWFVITVSVIFTGIAAYGLWKKQLF
jgi:hypothetical protein